MKNYNSLHDFYTGSDWEKCKASILNERLKSGAIKCDLCGEIILDSFNPNRKSNAQAMVFHHVQHLTLSNVNIADISINPANIQLLHWQCHNIVHNRFVGNIRSDQKVYIISGAPCSGKTTFVKEHMSAGDLILDIDDIWEQISGQPRYVKPGSLTPVAFATYKTIESQIKMRSGTWYQAFIIKSLPLRSDRNRYISLVNADEVITMDTTQEECMARLYSQPCGRNIGEYEKYINKYYSLYSE